MHGLIGGLMHRLMSLMRLQVDPRFRSLHEAHQVVPDSLVPRLDRLDDAVGRRRGRIECQRRFEMTLLQPV